MELLDADDENMVVKVTKKEFGDIISAFETVKMDYDRTDLSVVQMSKPRVSELLETLFVTLRQIPTLRRKDTQLRAVP